jgi:hypothetical protein
MTKKLLTNSFTEPLYEATTARFDIHAGDGNLTIDTLADSEQVLANGTLQYFEKQGLPTRNLISNNGQVALTLRGGAAGQPWLRLPWATCNGATEWQIHLNPTVSSDITAHSDGGNLKLDLAGMIITRLFADTGGGNIDVVLPDRIANLHVTAKTGAGNVVVFIPSDVSARIHATTGLGKAIIDPWFNKTDKDTYQSSDFDRASKKVEITVHSGAGNVSVNIK